MSKNNYIGNLSLSTTQKENRILPQYDLFVSYSEYDRAWVEGYLLDALKYAGVRHHRESAFTLGVPRILEFERAVQESKRTLLVLSKSYIVDGFNQFTDLLAQTYGLETATWPVIPLILDSSIRLPQRLAMLTSLTPQIQRIGRLHWSVCARSCSGQSLRQRPVPIVRIPVWCRSVLVTRNISLGVIRKWSRYFCICAINAFCWSSVPQVRGNHR